MDKQRLEVLLETENQQLQKLNDIVLQAIEEKKLLSQKLYEFDDTNPPLSSRLADKMASFGGSWNFIIFLWLW